MESRIFDTQMGQIKLVARYDYEYDRTFCDAYNLDGEYLGELDYPINCDAIWVDELTNADVNMMIDECW